MAYQDHGDRRRRRLDLLPWRPCPEQVHLDQVLPWGVAGVVGAEAQVHVDLNLRKEGFH